jgi:signal transduction histidine kinase
LRQAPPIAALVELWPPWWSAGLRFLFATARKSGVGGAGGILAAPRFNSTAHTYMGKGKLRTLMQASFLAKVLVPVIAIMVALLVITAWILNERITGQFEVEARRALTSADEGFRDWQKNRARNLLVRFSDLRNEPRYKAAFQTGDPPTVRAQLNDLLNSVDPEVKVVFFTTLNQETIASAKRDPLIAVGDFETASDTALREALQGDEKVETIHVSDKLYDVVSVPVFNASGDQVGALTFGLELSDQAAAELSRFTRSHIVLLANDQVIVTTLLTADSKPRLAALFKELVPADGKSRAGLRIRRETFDGQHYYCSAGRFATVHGDSTLGYALLYSYEDSRRALLTTQQVLLAANGLAIILGTFLVSVLIRNVTAPLRKLRDSAEIVGRGDFSCRVEVTSADECGMLARSFNQMTENLKRSREELETAHAELVETSRRAGMAEAATGVLHNIGNVLTSVNIATELIGQGLKKSKAAYLPKLVALMREHGSDLGAFLTSDPKGRQLPEYLSQLSEHLVREHEATLQELAQLQKGLEHVRDIVHSQQSYSKLSGRPETLEVAGLVEDALRMNAGVRSKIRVVKEFAPNLKVTAQKHKVLQILVNLLRNARQACEDSSAENQTLTIRTTDGDRGVRIAVSDNGTGIAPENLERIFSHGFTTKKDGHGFGLHNSASTAEELGGALSAHSDGVGKGATFTLELPAAND